MLQLNREIIRSYSADWIITDLSKLSQGNIIRKKILIFYSGTPRIPFMQPYKQKFALYFECILENNGLSPMAAEETQGPNYPCSQSEIIKSYYRVVL